MVRIRGFHHMPLSLDASSGTTCSVVAFDVYYLKPGISFCQGDFHGRNILKILRICAYSRHNLHVIMHEWCGKYFKSRYNRNVA